MKSLPILSIVTWLPTVGAIIILALFKKTQASGIKKFATAWFGLAFLASLLLLAYNRGLGGMQFLEDCTWIPSIGARYQMGVDGTAVLLIVLTTLLGIIAALSSWKYIEKREKEYYILLLLLQSAVVGVFTSMDLFLFYLFFEVSLVPMYFLIGIWGGENRLYAAIKFFLYTLVGSVVMLLGVLKMYFLTQDTALTSQITQATIDLLAGNAEAAAMVSNTLQAAAARMAPAHSIFVYMQSLGSVMPMGTMQVLLFFAFALGFAIKVPMFPFHTWLPDAHVEAPNCRFGHSRRHPAEVGNLRILPFQLADVSGGLRRRVVFRIVWRAQCDDLPGHHRNHLRRAGRDVFRRQERWRRKEAGRVFIGFVDGNRDARIVFAQSQRRQWRRAAHDQSRHLLRRALPAGRNHLRTPAHAECCRVWRAVACDARLRGNLSVHGDDCDWTAAAVRFHFGVSRVARGVSKRIRIGPRGARWELFLTPDTCCGSTSECSSARSIIRRMKN